MADLDADGFGDYNNIICSVKPMKLMGIILNCTNTIHFDCQDLNDDVFPNQDEYFDAPYLDTDENESYDYDCDLSLTREKLEMRLVNGI